MGGVLFFRVGCPTMKQKGLKGRNNSSVRARDQEALNQEHRIQELQRELKNQRGNAMEHKGAKEILRELAWMSVGTLLMAAATNFFFSPAEMVPGGFTGLAIIIEHFSSQFMHHRIPVWLGNIILNVPLIVFAILVRGWRFMYRTLFAAMMFSSY